MEITIHEEKISHFTFHGKKKRADHESRKYPDFVQKLMFGEFISGYATQKGGNYGVRGVSLK